MESKFSVENAIGSLISQKNYPCIAALRAFYGKEYRVGLYKHFGSGLESYHLGQDLLHFRNEQRRTKSDYLTFFAVFGEDSAEQSEEDFEKGLWRELSCLTSHAEFATGWDPNFSSNPEDKNFCFSLDGTAFFVVGLHPNSSRRSRRFPRPALVFNVYDQFRSLAQQGKYDPMVKVNRQQDLLFQGDVNPMVAEHGETWEAIQFSGRKNSADWKCPFHHGLKPEAGLVMG